MKEKQNKDTHVQIRLTCKEKEALRNEAKKQGVAMSKLLREKLFSYLVETIK